MSVSKIAFITKLNSIIIFTFLLYFSSEKEYEQLKMYKAIMYIVIQNLIFFTKI
jgi:hypothetical protein